jgi:hypothetical protein
MEGSEKVGVPVFYLNKDTHKPEIPYTHLRYLLTAIPLSPLYDASNGSTSIQPGDSVANGGCPGSYRWLRFSSEEFRCALRRSS